MPGANEAESVWDVCFSIETEFLEDTVVKVLLYVYIFFFALNPVNSAFRVDIQSCFA